MKKLINTLLGKKSKKKTKRKTKKKTKKRTTKSRSNKCPKCGKTFSSQKGLKIHMSKVH